MSWTTFRITRDSDIELLEQESDDMLRLIEDRLKARQRGEAVRLEVAAGGNEELSRTIIDDEGIRDGTPEALQRSVPHSRPARPDRPDGTDQESGPRSTCATRRLSPQLPRGIRRRSDDLFAPIARRDILLHHPFDSFDPVVDFISRAAVDPNVLAIKQTLVSHQRRLAGHAGFDAGCRKRQACDGAGRAQGALRRGRTTSAGPGNSNGPACTWCSVFSI